MKMAKQLDLVALSDLILGMRITQFFDFMLFRNFPILLSQLCLPLSLYANLKALLLQELVYSYLSKTNGQFEMAEKNPT